MKMVWLKLFKSIKPAGLTECSFFSISLSLAFVSIAYVRAQFIHALFDYEGAVPCQSSAKWPNLEATKETPTLVSPP
jgi:hypothetical protein